MQSQRGDKSLPLLSQRSLAIRGQEVDNEVITALNKLQRSDGQLNLEDFHDCLVSLHYLSAATTISKFKNPLVLNLGKGLRDDVNNCRDFLHQFWALLNPF